jgi:hypothetical protein|tara:strand:- start:3831 stop:4130 length:300 start_codon:yes stop_codon:yes gene_type:complete
MGSETTGDEIMPEPDGPQFDRSIDNLRRINALQAPGLIARTRAAIDQSLAGPSTAVTSDEDFREFFGRMTGSTLGQETLEDADSEYWSTSRLDEEGNLK